MVKEIRWQTNDYENTTCEKIVYDPTINPGLATYFVKPRSNENLSKIEKGIKSCGLDNWEIKTDYSHISIQTPVKTLYHAIYTARRIIHDEMIDAWHSPVFPQILRRGADETLLSAELTPENINNLLEAIGFEKKSG